MLIVWSVKKILKILIQKCLEQKNNRFYYDNYDASYDFYDYYIDFNEIFALSNLFCIYKIYLISAEGYKNAGVHFFKIRKTGEIWPSMKDCGSGLGVKNISDLILKEIYGIYEKKI